MENWTDKVFYHIYPLGMCGAPKENDFCSPAGKGLSTLVKHIPRLLSLGVNTLYIGPLLSQVLMDMTLLIIIMLNVGWAIMMILRNWSAHYMKMAFL
jgi:hypothetical protein